MIFHPEVADRSCADCKIWQYDEKSVEIEIHPPQSGGPVKRIGKVPCETVIGCPKGSPTAGRELTFRNRDALAHYLECRAVGWTPEEQADQIVRRNATIIRAVLDEAERQEKQSNAMLGKT